jgi:hypothetical protein
MSLANNSKFFNKRNFVAWFYRKLFMMTRKFSPENLIFLGTCFSLVSHSEQFSKNFCSVNSSLLLKQQRFILFAEAHQAEASHRTHVIIV